MERTAIAEQVATMLSATLEVPVDKLSDPETDLRDDLGMDSIDFVDLIEVLERELGRRVEPGRLKDVRTIEDVVDFVDELANRRDTAGAS